MHSEYLFRYISGNGDTCSFGFWWKGEAGRIEVRYRLPDRVRTSPRVDYDGEYVPQLHSIYKFWHPTMPFSPEFVQAFNAWEQGDHLEQVALMQARPGVYGTWAEIEHEYPPPVPVRGILWKDGKYEAIGA